MSTTEAYSIFSLDPNRDHPLVGFIEGVASGRQAIREWLRVGNDGRTRFTLLGWESGPVAVISQVNEDGSRRAYAIEAVPA